MLRVVIVVDGSEVDRRIIELAGKLLAGREAEIALLHVVPLHLDEEQGGTRTVVLEGFYTAEACGSEVAPLAQQLHGGPGEAGENHRQVLRLVPRHLIHSADPFGTVEHCDIARKRHDSLALLAICHRRLLQCGIDPAMVTRDSAIGNPAAIIQEAARHLGADLVLAGSQAANQAWHIAEDQGWPPAMAQGPCPVLIVSATDQAVRGEGGARRGRPAHT